MRYLIRYNILNKNQYGFQKGKSINKLLAHFSDAINSNFSKNLHSLVLFIDFSKAFDTLSHDKLLAVLYNYRIRGNSFKWFEN